MNALRHESNRAPEVVRWIRVHNESVPLLIRACESAERGYESRFVLRATGADYTVQQDESSYRRAWSGIERCVAALPEGAGIVFEYTGGGAMPFGVSVSGNTRERDVSVCEGQAQRACNDILYSLRSGVPHLSFAPYNPQDESAAVAMTWNARLWPASVPIDAGSDCAIGFIDRQSTPSARSRVIEFPRVNGVNWELDNRLTELLMHCPSPVAVRCRLSRYEMDEGTRALLPRVIKKLRSLDRADVHRAALGGLSKAWQKSPVGIRIDVRVSSPHMLPAPLVHGIGASLIGKHVEFEPMECVEQDGTDNGCGTPLCCIPLDWAVLSVFPQSNQLRETDVSRVYHRSPVLPDGEGIVLGRSITPRGAQTVRFRLEDRSRHCYLLGATGTGKSTLLRNMIVQDIRNGDGVCLIDPHGDLTARVLGAIPSYREKDLVLINPGHTRRIVGLNILERATGSREAEMHVIVNELMKMFERMFDRETRGPVFELYMRSALLLLMDNDLPPATLLDLPRVFHDETYRNHLKQHCKSRHVVDFWSKTAERMHGDWGLANMTPYITSKLNAFIYNGRVRAIVGQPRSTVNFYDAMQRRRIVIVTLTKGVLGELDTQLLGMIVMGKLFAAALRRGAHRADDHPPFCLYVDEFHQFCTDSVVQVISESRKFGLYLTLAHQNFTQLRGRTGMHDAGEAILGNAGTILGFRLGPTDAELMASYFGPELNARELQYLPNYHAAAKLLMNNAPLRPFVFTTLTPAPAAISGTQRRAIEQSYRRYAISASDARRRADCQGLTPITF